MQKIKELLGSVRFWLVVILSVAFALGYGDVINQNISKALEIFAGVSITIRTLDKFWQNQI